MMRNDYYVYAYLREDGSPYYIGKGTGRRAYQKSKRHLVRKPEDRTNIVFISENLTEEEAHTEEVKLIKKYGKKIDGGILVNISDGGEGGGRPAGWNHTEEARKKMSENRKGKGGGGNFVGRTHTEEARKSMSEARRGNQHTKGRVVPEEEKRRKSETLKEYYRKRREAGYKR